MPRGKQTVRLGQRDRDILTFIARHRTTWLEVLHRRFYRERHIDAVRSTMRRLCGRAPEFRYVHADLLDGQRNFFRLTRKGARIIGCPDHVASPLGKTAFIRCYSLQWFLELNGGEHRWSCNPRDYPELFALKGHRLPRANFYLEQIDSVTLLGFVIEDYDSDVRRLSRRACDLLCRFLEHGWFDELFASRRFALTFLTLGAEKANAIEKQFGRDSERRLAPLLNKLSDATRATLLTEFLVVPGLADLFAFDSSRKDRLQ